MFSLHLYHYLSCIDMKNLYLVLYNLNCDAYSVYTARSGPNAYSITIVCAHALSMPDTIHCLLTRTKALATRDTRRIGISDIESIPTGSIMTALLLMT